MPTIAEFDALAVSLEKVNTHYRTPESDLMPELLRKAEVSDEQKAAVKEKALNLVNTLRGDSEKQGGIDAFIKAYDLSSEEGIALMCLAEALLRVPDNCTIDDLIRDKITSVDWAQHRGKSHSAFVNSATWGLMLTGKLLKNDSDAVSQKKVTDSFVGLIGRTSEPFIRTAVKQAMQLMGEHFVMGQTIEEALKRAGKGNNAGFEYSFDMLGEAARTQADAERYFESYCKAIDAVAVENDSTKPLESVSGISVKISALHPRYEVKKRDTLLSELYPKMKALALRAKAANVQICFDAEESERLLLSLQLIGALLKEPELAGFHGMGLAVQAYQKRALHVIEWLAEVTRNANQRIMVRLVKGAYWDTEIKNAQVMGHDDYPVFTRKTATDINYLVCAKAMLAASDVIYPQFATHNAQTLASLLVLAEDSQLDLFEFQCLHGMGRPLYEALRQHTQMNYRCRIYAPVGSHQDLLAYLVRRLLENGANSSFINQMADTEADVDWLVADPTEVYQSFATERHPQIPLPKSLYSDRANSGGIDLSDQAVLDAAVIAYNKQVANRVTVSNPFADSDAEPIVSVNPANHEQVLGSYQNCSEAGLLQAMAKAKAAFDQKRQQPIELVQSKLLKLADLIESRREQVFSLLQAEAGKSLDDADAEVREAVDFCRYYALQSEKLFQPQVLEGPTGERNVLTHHGRGVLLCISPWNFPLAIFLGQITAALAAGNTVLAKPASTTTLIADWTIKQMYEVGFSESEVILVPASSRTVDSALLHHPDLSGVMLTGSTRTAQVINQRLAAREGAILPLIAETGGQNAMVVDSTALPEQVVGDLIKSAFLSAGQRCSATRVLFIQSDVADKFIEMLKGAMAALKVGTMDDIETDLGPVINEAAKASLESHVSGLLERAEAELLFQVPLPSHAELGTFMAPTLLEIPSLSVLKEEVFGPVLHLIRFDADDLPNVIQSINHTGFGLTFGVHSRIEAKIAQILSQVNAGNLYVNRNMVGAIVGVQPFGGEGLSGTGPKAGGPNYLSRLTLERVVSTDTTASGGNASLMSLSDEVAAD